MYDQPLTWNALRDLSRDHSARAFQELLDKLESIDKLREQRYANTSRALGVLEKRIKDAEEKHDELEDAVHDVESDVESLDYNHGKAIADVKARVVELETKTSWQGVQTEAQLVEWESRIVSQLEQLPTKKRPNYYHSLANFIVGEDVARLKELFDEIKTNVEVMHRVMYREGGE